MIDINPETLMAYVDGELDPEQQAMVDELIKRDPEARAMADQFRQSADLLHESYREILDLPVPQRLIDTLQNHKSEANVREFPRLANTKSRLSWPSLALAASVILCLGIWAGSHLFTGPGSNLLSSSYALLQKTLETRSSGLSRTSDNGLQTVTPIMTFYAADGRVCREFERSGNDQKSAGVACRDSSGQWQVLAEIDQTLLAADSTGGVDHYQPAAGDNDPLGNLLSSLGAGKGLSTAEEQALKAQGWNAPGK